jgi:hypothetical protein
MAPPLPPPPPPKGIETKAVKRAALGQPDIAHEPMCHSWPTNFPSFVMKLHYFVRKYLHITWFKKLWIPFYSLERTFQVMHLATSDTINFCCAAAVDLVPREKRRLVLFKGKPWCKGTSCLIRIVSWICRLGHGEEQRILEVFDELCPLA